MGKRDGPRSYAEINAGLAVKRAQLRLQIQSLIADLAGKQEILRQQQVIVIVVKRHRHPVVGKHQEGQRAAVDLILGDQVTDEGLKKRLIRDPGG